MYRRLIGVLIAAVALTAVAFPPGTSLAQTKTLRMANWLPTVHHMTLTLKAWTNEVERASGGTLKIRVLPPGLAKPPGQYDLAKNGIVDISWGVAAYTRGRFPLVRVMELPFMSPNAEVGSLSLWQWYIKHGLNELEFNDTRLLLAFVHGPGVLHTKKQVRNLEDLAGLKLRVGGGGVAMADKLGAVPVPMSATKAHESLQKGTTTGALFPWESIKGFRLNKLVKYHLTFPGGLYTTSFFMTMNKRSWNKLSDEHKSVLNRVGRAWGSQFIGRFWDSADTVGKQAALANGNTVSAIDPAEMDRWREKIRFMSEEWVAKANAAGQDGRALLDDLIAIIKKNSR
ncbi:MAG: TRAP transporter substrate-binding protein [bacterium]